MREFGPLERVLKCELSRELKREPLHFQDIPLCRLEFHCLMFELVTACCIGPLPVQFGSVICVPYGLSCAPGKQHCVLYQLLQEGPSLCALLSCSSAQILKCWRCGSLRLHYGISSVCVCCCSLQCLLLLLLRTATFVYSICCQLLFMETAT